MEKIPPLSGTQKQAALVVKICLPRSLQLQLIPPLIARRAGEGSAGLPPSVL